LLFCEEVTLTKPTPSTTAPPVGGDTVAAPGSAEKHGTTSSLSRPISKKQAASIRPTSSTNGNGTSTNNGVVVSEDESHGSMFPSKSASIDPMITHSNDSSSANPVVIVSSSSAAATARDQRSPSVTSNRGEDAANGGNDSGKKDEPTSIILPSSSSNPTEPSPPPTASSQPPPSLATSAMRNSLRDLFRSNNTNNMNGSSSSSSSESNSRKLVISHRKIVELLLFMLCMLYHRQSLSNSQKNLISLNNDFLKLIQVLKDLLFNQTTLVTELFSSSGNSNQQQYYTLSQFLTTIFTPLSTANTSAPGPVPSSGAGTASEGKGKTVINKVLSSLCVSRLMVMNIFQPFFYDIVPNPYDVSTLMLD
jgi:hypothetical protein